MTSDGGVCRVSEGVDGACAATGEVTTRSSTAARGKMERICVLS